MDIASTGKEIAHEEFQPIERGPIPKSKFDKKPAKQGKDYQRYEKKLERGKLLAEQEKAEKAKKAEEAAAAKLENKKRKVTELSEEEGGNVEGEEAEEEVQADADGDLVFSGLDKGSKKKSKSKGGDDEGSDAEDEAEAGFITSKKLQGSSLPIDDFERELKINELKDRLRAKIEAARQARGADKAHERAVLRRAAEKEKISADKEKRRQVKSKKEPSISLPSLPSSALESSKALLSPARPITHVKPENNNPAKKPKLEHPVQNGSSSSSAPVASSSSSSSSNNKGDSIAFKLDAGEAKPTASSDLKLSLDPEKGISKRILLKNAQALQAKLDQLKGTEEGQKMKEQIAFDNAMKKAQGERVKDVNKLKKDIKRKEQKKRKSQKEWADRMSAAKDEKEARIEKREGNIQAKHDSKKAKVAAKQGKGRPGFEGARTSYLNKE